MLKIFLASFAVISPDASWLAFGPELALLVTAIGLLILASSKADRKWALITTLGGITLSFLINISALGTSFPDPKGLSFIQIDAYTQFFIFLFLTVAAITAMFSVRYLKMYEGLHHEFFALLLFSTIGMMVMVSSRDFLVMYLGLETMSITAYVLTGYLIPHSRSQEAALKYFLTGALGSAIFLFGMAYIYGATGSIQFAVVGKLAAQAMAQSTFFVVGATFLIAGFAFKVAAVPFHMWAPDVYDGAPTPITGFMAVGIKAAAFSVLVRIVFVSLDVGSSLWFDTIFFMLAAGTMIWGNVAAIAQRNIKRMLAYSSVAHAGYLLLAVAARSDMTSYSVQFYLLSYLLMNLGAFGVVALFEKKDGQSLDIYNYAGLGTRYPVMAVSLSIFLFSLAGIPPTAGFLGKWLVFSSAILTGKPVLLYLAVLGVMTSLVSAYYYLRVVYIMFMMPADSEALTAKDPYHIEQILIPALVIGVIFLGLLPQGPITYAKRSSLPRIALNHAKLLKKAKTPKKPAVRKAAPKPAIRKAAPKPAVRKAVPTTKPAPRKVVPTTKPAPRK